MLSIVDNAITLTRGDSATFTVGLEKDGDSYVPAQGDYIRFALSKGYKGEYGYKRLLVKQIPYDTLEFTLTPEETGALSYETYNYDVELVYEDGNTDTFISSTMTITGECD